MNYKRLIKQQYMTFARYGFINLYRQNLAREYSNLDRKWIHTNRVYNEDAHHHLTARKRKYLRKLEKYSNRTHNIKGSF